MDIFFKSFAIVKKRLIRLNRKSKQFIMVLVDSVLIVTVLLISFAVRLNEFYWPQNEMFWVIFEGRQT